MKLLVALLLAALAPLLVAVPARAFDPLGPVCKGSVANTPTCKENGENQIDGKENPAVHIIRIATTIMALLIGVIAVIMIIIGGLTMAISAGNAERAQKARARVIYSLVALAITALAWLLVSFLIQNFVKT